MHEPYTVLHGGFHKTATTYLQNTLKRNQNHLLKRGVHYVHHRDLRKKFTVPCQLNAYEKVGVDRRTKVSDAELREMTKEFFRPILKQGPDRLILSDENMAGHCGQCVRRGVLYHFRDAFIEVFAGEIPLPVREVHLSVRNYADFFAGAYVEYIRSLATANIFTTQAQMKTRVLGRMPSWYRLLLTVHGYFPEARIHVWRFEDFREVSPVVMQNLCGSAVDVGKLTPPKADKPRVSASGRAIAELEMIAQVEGLEAVVRERRAIQDRYPRGDRFPGHDPWSAQERRHLTQTYEQDWAMIANNPAFTTVVPVRRHANGN